MQWFFNLGYIINWFEDDCLIFFGWCGVDCGLGERFFIDGVFIGFNINILSRWGIYIWNALYTVSVADEVIIIVIYTDEFNCVVVGIVVGIM